MLFLIAKTTAAAFNSLTFNSTPTAENIDCNNFVITVTCCRATLVVSWPEEQPCRTTLVVVCPVAWSNTGLVTTAAQLLTSLLGV